MCGTVWLSLAFIGLSASAASAGMLSAPPQKVKAIVVGDRVVDIAYNLGVLPDAMVARVSLWPMGAKIKIACQPLGCPMRATVKQKDVVPLAMKQFGTKRVVVENKKEYCLYAPGLSTMDVVPLLEGTDADIHCVDFSQGIESAIKQTAKIFGKEDKATELIEKYRKNTAMTQEMIPAEPLNKKVVVIKGVYQPSTGKSQLQVEAPGMYADTFMLKPLGCTNVGEVFNPEHAKPSKGHYMVKKSRGGFDLSPLIEVDPDVIVAVGDVMSVQKAIQRYAEKNPELKTVKAIRNLDVYGLPAYIDSSVIEYPEIFRQWIVALAR
jgi:ABC-type Fe2+-enterobactin transport system substrate-binding protein